MAWLSGLDSLVSGGSREAITNESPSQGAELEDNTSTNMTPDILASLDSLITLPARAALDVCYDTDRPEDKENCFGTACPLREDERKVLETQQQAMQQLKRKRRPTTLDRRGEENRNVRRRTDNNPILDITNISRELGLEF